MTYIDGFVTPVPRDNRAAYEHHVAQAAAIFADLGATRLVECRGDDVPAGTHTDFARAVALTDDEDVLFSWIEYPDRATRDAAGAAMMADPRMAALGMPFDGKRMIYGGFDGVMVRDGEGTGTAPGYVDGCLTPVPAAGRDAYIAFAAESAQVFRDHGALRVVEGWGDDVPAGKHTDFARAVALRDGEIACYSWIEWPSKDARNNGWQAVMADPRMADRDMPFDGRRMVYGGFLPVFDQRMGADA
ncbi:MULTISPECIES: DUF1428 domain-containing protein [unclassified Sphingomonas]|uniref:DUF1428 domain-containing protein n=1 Tax=unclassified Sphingomonas TaxID=196159 RepID=UPI0009E92D16|nr:MULTISPECIES: DUF1428 domain-containing protein [unclassified Sphingomonas]